MNIEFRAVELTMFLGVLVVFASMIFMPFIRLSNIGEGRHSGYITALEQEGYFFPNYRVYFKTDNSSSQEDIYCMDRRRMALAEKLTEYNQKKQRVTIEFHGVQGIGLDLCQGVEITNVKVD